MSVGAQVAVVDLLRAWLWFPAARTGVTTVVLGLKLGESGLGGLGEGDPKEGTGQQNGVLDAQHCICEYVLAARVGRLALFWPVAFGGEAMSTNQLFLLLDA